jgi:hypothetical protein
MKKFILLYIGPSVAQLPTCRICREPRSSTRRSASAEGKEEPGRLTSGELVLRKLSRPRSGG